MPFPASVSPCAEMTGHPLFGGFRWHRLLLNHLQVTIGAGGGGGMLGNHARVLLMGGTGGLQTGGQGFLWMGGTQGSAEGGTGGQGAFHVGGSADRGDRAPVDGGDKSLCRPRGQGSLQKGGQGSL